MLDALVSTFCSFVCRAFTFTSVVNSWIATRRRWKGTVPHSGTQQHAGIDMYLYRQVHNTAHTWQHHSGWKPVKKGFLCHPMPKVCVCVCTDSVHKLFASVWSSKHCVPRTIQGHLFVGPPRDPAYTDGVSQTSTTYLPATTLHPPPRPPHSTLHPNPINDTGPGKRERRVGDRHEMWHEMQKQSPSDTHSWAERTDVSAFQPSLQCG